MWRKSKPCVKRSCRRNRPRRPPLPLHRGRKRSAVRGAEGEAAEPQEETAPPPSTRPATPGEGNGAPEPQTVDEPDGLDSAPNCDNYCDHCFSGTYRSCEGCGYGREEDGAPPEREEPQREPEPKKPQAAQTSPPAAEETRCTDGGICPHCRERFDAAEAVNYSMLGTQTTGPVKCPHCGKLIKIFCSVEYFCSAAEE